MEEGLFISNLFPKAENLIVTFYILMRVLGLLYVSPLLSNKSITASTRFYLGFFITLVLSFSLFPADIHPSKNLSLPEYNSLHTDHILLIAIISIKELLVGYLIGFCFNIIFESMLMAGELIDSMIGFSTAQFVDPFSNTFHSLLGQLLVFTGALFMLILDLHHVFIRLLADSFSVIPIGHYFMKMNLLQKITLDTSWIYVFAIKYGAIPIIVLSINLVGIACTVRVVPEMNLLLTGLPLRVMYGIWAMMIAISRIIPLFKDTFFQIQRLVEQIILDIGLG
jgi:flagellar biosynthesis protein FliR